MKTSVLRNLCIPLLSIFIISSCTKENENGGGVTFTPINLECQYQTDTNLTNHNPNGVDYIASCDVEIQDGTFTIEEGTTIQFADGASMIISLDGILKARGKSGNPITMTGTDSGTPTWRGIYINSSIGSNVLEHVNIEDAGDGEEFGQNHGNHASVTVQGRISMSNCIIKNSGNHGIFSEESLSSAQFDNFENNSILQCKKYPILVNQNHISDMNLTSCSVTENGENYIGLHQENGDRLTTSTTLKALETPYLIESGIDLHAGLTLEAGVDIVMGNGAYIDMTSDQNQYLLIQGSQSNHITIRGKEAISGYWKGIYILQPNSLNVWEYLDISDGGSEVQGFNNTSANVTLEKDANLTINNCTSARNGGGCDIVLSLFFSTNPVLENNSPQISAICTE